MRRPRRPDAAILYCSVRVAAVGSTSPFAYSGIQESAGIGIQHGWVQHQQGGECNLTTPDSGSLPEEVPHRGRPAKRRASHRRTGRRTGTASKFPSPFVSTRWQCKCLPRKRSPSPAQVAGRGSMSLPLGGGSDRNCASEEGRFKMRLPVLRKSRRRVGVATSLMSVGKTGDDRNVSMFWK